MKLDSFTACLGSASRCSRPFSLERVTSREAALTPACLKGTRSSPAEATSMVAASTLARSVAAEGAIPGDDDDEGRMYRM